jgi:alpha-galactosidase
VLLDILNSWEGAYFSFDEKTITDMIDDAAKFGMEMFVQDDCLFLTGK